MLRAFSTMKQIINVLDSVDACDKLIRSKCEIWAYLLFTYFTEY